MAKKTRRLKMAGYVPPVDLAAERRAQVAKLYAAGYRQTDIADMVGVTQARVSQIMTEIERRRKNKRRMLRKMPPPQAALFA